MVITPTVYDYHQAGTGHAHLKLDKPYEWSGKTVSGILEQRFENTHEPLIDRETWDIVQKVRQGKRRPNKMGVQDMLSGLVECEVCGTKHYLCRCGSWNEEQYT